MERNEASMTTAKFVTRASAFVIGVVILAIWLVISITLVTANRVNRIESERQNSRFVASIETEIEKQRLDVMTAADGKPLLDAAVPTPDGIRADQLFLRRMWSLYGFPHAYLVDAKARMITGMESGRLADRKDYDLIAPLVSRTVEQAAAHGPGGERGAAFLLHDGTRSLFVIAEPLRRTPAGAEGDGFKPPFVALGVKEWKAEDLAAFATRQGIDDFSIVTDVRQELSDALPLKNGKGEISAYLRWKPSKPGEAIVSEFLYLIIGVIALITVTFILVFTNLRHVAVGIARRERRFSRLAAHDALSGLLNRRAFDARLDEAVQGLAREDAFFALHFVDLDKFKPVNDLHGHRIGDDVIRQVGARLRALARPGDSVARLGGDEFAILQIGVASQDEARQLAEGIIETIGQPFHTHGVAVSIGASVGIARAPSDATEREALMRLADTALYKAKSAGRNRYYFFEHDMERTLNLRRLDSDELRRAIEQDELTLHYQPQWTADGRTMLGVEALVRWRHPIHGMIAPSEFIPIAEQRGLIVPLSRWVLRRACQDGKRWPELRIAVNVSAIDFRNRDFVESVARILRETGFEPSRLELELTESVIVEDADAAEQAMIELRGLGVGLALDDFGSGYSSLIYLRRFAFDKIKIDRGFLEYMETTGESAILVHSVVHLGRALGLIVCAEGVETAEQHRFLQAVGCHELQGYFFARPMPAMDIDALLGIAPDIETASDAVRAA